MRGMSWKKRLFLKVDECARQLDEGLVKTAVGITASEPQVLEYIVCLVVHPCVEAEKEGSVFARVAPVVWGCLSVLSFSLFPLIEPGLENRIFFHSLCLV